MKEVKKLNTKSIVIVQVAYCVSTFVASFFLGLLIQFVLTLNTKPDFFTFNKVFYIITFVIWATAIAIFEIFFWTKTQKLSAGKIKTKKTIDEEKESRKEFDKIPRKNIVWLSEKIGLIIETLKAATIVIGKTGKGKTETLKKIIHELKEKRPKSVTIIIDGKGDRGLIDELKDEDTFVWDFDGTNIWNPIQTDDEAVIVDKLSTFLGDHDYFKGRGQRHLDYIVKLMKITKEPLSLPNIFSHLDLESFSELQLNAHKSIGKTATEQEQWTLKATRNWINAVDKKDISGLSDAIYNMYSPLTKALGHENNLNEIIKNHSRVIFSLNSLKNSDRAGMIGKLLVQDLKELAVNKDPNVEVNVFLDELNVFISDDLINMINKTRSYGFKNFLSFQTIGDLKGMEDIIFGNSTNVILHETPSVETKEYMAKYFRTREMIETTSQIDLVTRESSKGSKKVVDEFIVHPNDISALRSGEAFVKISLPSGHQMIERTNIQRVEQNDWNGARIVPKQRRQLELLPTIEEPQQLEEA